MKKKYKICVYAICKNEEKFVDRWCKQFKDADLIIVGDTGSTDKTIEKFKNNGVEVHNLNLETFRFDDARNAVLNLIPEDVDICLTLDIDEIISKGWRKELESQWEDTTTRGEFTYNWTFNADGSVCSTFPFQRLHSRKNYEWKFPIHEVVSYVGEGRENRKHIKNVFVQHEPDKKKSRAFYLDLLEETIKEYPNEPRNYHYLGREYMYYSKHDKCINMLNKYLSMPNATWNEERSASMRFISRSYIELGCYNEARNWLLKAIAEANYLREPLVEMSMLAYKQKDWLSMYYFAKKAVMITDKNLGYVHDHFAWNHIPFDLIAISSYWLGYKDEAIKYNNLALKLLPDDKRLLDNGKLYEKMKD